MNPPLGQLDQAIYDLSAALTQQEQIRTYIIGLFWSGTPDNNQMMAMHVLTSVQAEFAAGMPGSKARCRVAPSAQQVFSIQRNGVEVGTCTFGAGQVTGVFAAAADFTCEENDYLTIVAPASVDASIEDISITLKGDKQTLFFTTTTAPPVTTTTSA
jgi:hypothetical protein